MRDRYSLHSNFAFVQIDVTGKLKDDSTPDLGQFSFHQRSYIIYIRLQKYKKIRRR